MIKRIFANKDSFKSIEFQSGFNIVVADTTSNSTSKDSRNGSGKSTIIEIIHFCLGSEPKKGEGLRVEGLKDWIFYLELTLENISIIVGRAISDINKIYLVDGADDLKIPYKLDNEGRKYILVKEWTNLLSRLMFGLTNEELSIQYSPNFRGLISYFIRRKKGAFLSPFAHFSQQKEWNIQVCNSFLLGLNWEYASKWQLLKDQEKMINQLKVAAKSGLMKGLMGGTIGELEAQKIRLESQIKNFKLQLENFKVYPQYKEIEEKSNILTMQIHKFTNKNITDKRLVEFYKKSLSEEVLTTTYSISEIYHDANVNFPELVKVKLEQVEEFHKKVIKNRKDFLTHEIDRLELAIIERDSLIKENTEKRAEYLQILEEHGALEEYTKLQQFYLGEISKLKEINFAIENLRDFEKGKSSLKIEKTLLQQQAQNDYFERLSQRTKAIQLFNANSEYLYEESGELLIDITDSGFKFAVQIDKSGSEGIEHMKIFCYDLMLAQLWSKKFPSPKLLIHDSSIFDPVDERQINLALQLAKNESEERSFQYICLVNSDKVDLDDELRKHIRIRLTDESESSGVLGIRI